MLDFFDFRNLQIPVIVSNSKALAETLEKNLFEQFRFFDFSTYFLIFPGSWFLQFWDSIVFFLGRSVFLIAKAIPGPPLSARWQAGHFAPNASHTTRPRSFRLELRLFWHRHFPCLLLAMRATPNLKLGFQPVWFRLVGNQLKTCLGSEKFGRAWMGRTPRKHIHVNCSVVLQGGRIGSVSIACVCKFRFQRYNACMHVGKILSQPTLTYTTRCHSRLGPSAVKRGNWQHSSPQDSKFWIQKRVHRNPTYEPPSYEGRRFMNFCKFRYPYRILASFWKKAALHMKPKRGYIWTPPKTTYEPSWKRAWGNFELASDGDPRA